LAKSGKLAACAAFTRVPTTERPLVLGAVCANTDVIARMAPTAAAAAETPILNMLFFGTLVLLG
jgi:hypothetical protein